MFHVLKLGFKQNPSGTDDYIDLGGGLNDANNKGYHLKSYLEGPVTTDEYGHMVRDLTIVVGIDNATIAGAMAAYHAIDRYIQQTRIYLKPFKGNWAATTDGTWYSGFCATLTFQPVGATSPVYWDVLGGSVTRDETYLGPDLVGADLENVTVTLTVRYSARGNLVTMCNLVAMGSFEPPFSPQDTYFNAGWTFANTAVWSVDFGSGKFGPNALKWVGVASTTVTTNENDDIYYKSLPPTSGNALFPFVSGAISLKATGVTGTATVTLESYNGTAWSTLATIASGIGNLAAWTSYKVENVALTAGMLKLRVKITTPTAGTLYVDGVAIWRSATVPANGEYFTSGGQVGFPSTYLYGAIGDVEAPCILHIASSTRGPSSSPLNAQTNVMVGARKHNWTSVGRDSIPALAAQYVTGSTNTFNMFGKNGNTISAGGSTPTFYLNPQACLVNPILKVPHKYRIILAYNNTIASTSVRISFKDFSALSYNSKTFTRAIPSTGGADKLFDLGDVTYPAPDTTLQDQLFTGFNMSAGGLTSVVFFLGGGVYTLKFNGYILLPTEYFAFVYNVGDYGTVFSSMADPENGSVKAMQAGVQVAYTPSLVDEASTTSVDNSDTLQVVPGAMEFVILSFGIHDATYNDLYDYSAAEVYTPTLAYQPRYLSGGM